MTLTDLTYYRPESLAEYPVAIQMAEGEPYCLYGGGSEILSMARVGSIRPRALIDIKSIPECRVLQQKNGQIVLGGAATLSEIAESGIFPLLGTTVSRIADHTNQCRITLAGNVCGTIQYREAVLPLLLSDATVRTFLRGQTSDRPLAEAFDGRFRRAPEELVVQFLVPAEAAGFPFVHVKRTRGDKIDYPMATIAAVRAPEGLRLAFSGVKQHPFRDAALEKIASDAAATPSARADAILAQLREGALEDQAARREYRLFVLREALVQTLTRLEAEA